MLPPSLYKLILDRAIATIDCSPAEQEQFRQQYYSNQAYQTWLQQQGVTAEQFESWANRELSIRKFQKQQWGRKINSYFLERKRQLDQVVCSLIYLQDANMAQELYFRIVEAEQSFAEIAYTYSLGVEATLGGKLGPIELGHLHPELAHRFYGGQPGQLWEPMEMDQWIVIAQLDEKRPVRLDELMRQYLLNELLEQWAQEQLNL